MIRDELRSLRQEAGLTQKEFAEKIGVSVTTVCDNESGKVKNHVNYVRRINKCYGTDFPLVSECNLCGEEFFGSARYCRSCKGELPEKREAKAARSPEIRRLKEVAEDAERQGVSYGNFVAGIKKLKASAAEKGKNSKKAPAYLGLGKVVKI